jgi:hypothetical protein
MYHFMQTCHRFTGSVFEVLSPYPGYKINMKFLFLGIEEFLFYSINWEIKGLPLGDSNETQVLGPISRVSMASSIDFHAGEILDWRQPCCICY